MKPSNKITQYIEKASTYITFAFLTFLLAAVCHYAYSSTVNDKDSLKSVTADNNSFSGFAKYTKYNLNNTTRPVLVNSTIQRNTMKLLSNLDYKWISPLYSTDNLRTVNAKIDRNGTNVIIDRWEFAKTRTFYKQWRSISMEPGIVILKF